MIRNQKGQAFSTFQLLISAVIAMAILMVLLPIIGSIFVVGNDPATEATTLVKNYVDQKGLWGVSKTQVTFNKDGSLKADTIATSSGKLSNNQVCLKVPESLVQQGFIAKQNQLVQWKEDASKLVKLGVICNRKVKLENDLSLYDLPSEYGDCDPQCPNENETCCIVVVLQE